MHNHNHDEHEHHHHTTDAVIPADRLTTHPVTSDTVDVHQAETAGHVREYKGKKYHF